MSKTTSIDTQDTNPEEQTVSPGEILIGELTAIDNAGRPLVVFSDMPDSEALVAMTTQEITHKHVGRQVALLFTSGETKQPVIVGLIHDPLADMLEKFSIPEAETEFETPFYDVKEDESPLLDIAQDKEQQVLVDGKRVTIEGAEEITLKCGKASITLTKSGKILIRGTYLSNRSSGVNRILGGSVQIN